MSAAWEALAYQLWRRGLRTPTQISQHLAGEGWAVTPAEVEAVVVARVQRSLDELATRPRRMPS
jgi:hypothetical protein